MTVLIWWLPTLLVVVVAALVINRRRNPRPTPRQLRAIGAALTRPREPRP